MPSSDSQFAEPSQLPLSFEMQMSPVEESNEQEDVPQFFSLLSNIVGLSASRRIIEELKLP